MKGVFVDTSLRVAHIRQRNNVLIALLELDLALLHPMVFGELASGTPPARRQMLDAMALLQQPQQPQQARRREVLDFFERERLFGLGCGLVNMILLASKLMTPGAKLWTVDMSPAMLAERFEVMHRAIPH